MTSGNWYSWQEISKQWGEASKVEYTYDADGNIALNNWYNWDENISQWVISNKETYYYSERNINALLSIPAKYVIVYPNPATDIIVFDLTNISESAKVEVFDIQGKKVLEQKLSENKQISISNLPKGLYLFRLHDIENIYIGKITLEL
jgi:hypothetical protein